MSTNAPTTPAKDADARRDGLLRRVRHVKTGGEYDVIGEAWVQSAFALVDLDRLTLYRGGDGRMWVRPPDEFEDGRFVDIVSAEAATPTRHDASERPGRVEEGVSEAEVEAALDTYTDRHWRDRGNDPEASKAGMREALEAAARVRPSPSVEAARAEERYAIVERAGVGLQAEALGLSESTFTALLSFPNGPPSNLTLSTIWERRPVLLVEAARSPRDPAPSDAGLAGEASR